MKIVIKEIEQQDIQACLDFVLEIFMEFEAPDYTNQGVTTFKSFLKDKITISSLHFYGAYNDNVLTGVIATRNTTHISILFVKKEYHRQGIARALFNHILPLTNQNIITVNSSPYAAKAYHHLGFTYTDCEQNVDGIRFTPMTYTKQQR